MHLAEQGKHFVWHGLFLGRVISVQLSYHPYMNYLPSLHELCSQA